MSELCNNCNNQNSSDCANCFMAGLYEQKNETESKKEEFIKSFEAKLYKITSYDLQKNDTEFFETLNEEKKKT